MPAYSRELEEAQREIDAVEAALEAGHPPPHETTLGDNRTKTAIRAAAEKLGGIPAQSLRGRVGVPGSPGSTYRRFGIGVDWSKYKPPPEQEAAGPFASRELQEPNADPIEVRRLRDALDKAKSTIKELERRVIKAEDLRGDVIGLRDMPVVPVSFPSPSGNPGSAETVVLVLSDLHWGEKVELEAMDGLNSFSLAIARNRLVRWTTKVIELLTTHWSGPPPERIILILGGDLISGGIHHELAKTDELRPLPSVRDVADHLIAAILKISTEVRVFLDVISIPGNHSRTTLKPESKEYARTSLDILVSDFLELGLRDREGVKFYAPASPDALFSVYGWTVLATHGDKIGSRGGQGFVGPAATVARGMKKVAADYAARGIHVDLIIVCHFHTPLMLEEGFCNGSLPGPTEYSRDGRFTPHPAVQLMFTIHPKHKHPQIRWIEVGDPSEGSLYEPPPPSGPVRGRFGVRVEASSS